MKTASAIYKMLRASGENIEYEIRVICGSKTYGMDTLKNVTVHQALSSESGMGIGGTQASECRLTVIEDSANWERMAQFTLQFRNRNRQGTTVSEWITVGTFYTDERSEDKHGNLSIVGYDGMLLTEQYWTDKVPSSLLPSSYPISARAFCSMIQSAGLCTFEDLTKIDDSVQFIGLDTGSTIRDKLKDIASSHAGNWIVTGDGSLRLIRYDQLDKYASIAGLAVVGIAIVGLEDLSKASLPNYPKIGLSYKTFDSSPIIDRVSGVTLETEAGETASAGSDSGYVLKGTCNFSSTDGVADLCLSRAIGFAYRPFYITGAYLDPIVEVGDIVITEGSSYFQIMSIDWNFNKYPTASLSAPYDEEVDHEYTIVSPQAKTYRKSLAALAETEAELTSSIEQTASSIKATVAKSQNKYDTKSYNVTLYGYGTPTDNGYKASAYNGVYYLDQSNGKLYRSNGSTWSVADTLQLISDVQEALIEETASSIKATVASSQKQYDEGSYTVSYYGFGTPAEAGYPASGNNGKYYLNQSNGFLYRSNGSSWSKAAELQLITTVQQSSIEQNATDITAKVSKEGGIPSSFGWTLTDSAHTWFGNGVELMKLQQSGLVVTGEVRATSGYIGNKTNGFTITASSIYNGKNAMNSTSAGVYVGKDGIALGAYNANNGNSAFQVTKDGVITARSGTVGGFTLSASSLYNGKNSMTSTSAGVYVGTNGIALGAYDSTNKNSAFQVTSSGVLTARSGTVGGFTLSASSIYNGMTSFGDTTHNGVYIGTNGIALGKGNFKVTSAGAVTAKNLEITGGSIKIGGTLENPTFEVDSSGNLYANNGYFLGLVQAGSIVSAYTNPDTPAFGYFNGGGLTQYSVSGGYGGQIGYTNNGGLIGANMEYRTIEDAYCSDTINTALVYANYSNGVFTGVTQTNYLKASYVSAADQLIVGGYDVVWQYSSTLGGYVLMRSTA